MTSGDHDDARAERQQLAGQILDLPRLHVDVLLSTAALPHHPPCERTRLGQVRRDHARARQDLLDQRVLRSGVEQARARLRDHHRVHDDGNARGQLVERAGHRVHGVDRAEHPDLDRVDANIGQDRPHLGEDHLGRDRRDRLYADGVLGGDRSDRRRPVHAAACEGLQVRLDAGSATGVRAGYRERRGHHRSRRRGRPERPRPCAAGRSCSCRSPSRAVGHPRGARRCASPPCGGCAGRASCGR